MLIVCMYFEWTQHYQVGRKDVLVRPVTVGTHKGVVNFTVLTGQSVCFNNV